jgi:hypothetical protein
LVAAVSEYPKFRADAEIFKNSFDHYAVSASHVFIINSKENSRSFFPRCYKELEDINIWYILHCAKEVNVAKENANFTCFYIKLDKTQNTAGGDISQIDGGYITPTVFFSFTTE